jgi:hypothetical protein
MRTLFTYLLLTTGTLWSGIATGTVAIAQNSITTESLDKEISAHFEKYQPELFRYSGLTIYGESKTTFEKVQIERELELFNQVKNSDLITKPTENVFALCHNIIIHSPDSGREFLKLLNKETNDENTISSLYSEIMFTGEFGEQLALDNLESDNKDWSKTWSNYLSLQAIYESSISRIEKLLKETDDIELKQDLIGALMYISNPKSKEIIRQIIETTTNDYVQAKAIFAYVELTGYDGMSYLKSIQTKGEKSNSEKKSSIDWLKKETSPKNNFGLEVDNDIDFIMRFGDIKSPVIIWLDKEGLLDEKKAEKPTAFAKDKKDKLIDLLIESKGFALEAAKGQLFLSIELSDIGKLLALRQMCLYSPNNFTQGRLKTIGIFVRSLRKRVQ